VDVGAWLRGLGLERYEQAFRDNDVDGEILRELTGEDLIAMGVASVGHRRKLLQAIAVLKSGSITDTTHDEEESDAQPQPGAATSAPSAAERRQLTVMFVDLVGSTELSARLDPEDLGALMRAYQNAVAGEVAHLEGHVAKYMGDGVLAYFGWPRAHEDEAERAVRAAIAIQGAVARLTAPEPLSVRIGIATGLVVVGELIGEGAAREESVVGETPNLAARLQGLAEPGGVVISQATRRLVGGLFALADLGPRRLKGFAEPLAAWRVEGEGRAEGRFEALHGERLTPLVGREHELGILLERWGWAKGGDGQVVLLAGEPGIGKSRMIRALREHLGDETYAPLSHYCSPYHTNSALYPVIGLLEREARLDRDEPPEEQLARIEALLSRWSDGLDEVVPLLAALLGVPTGERYPPLTLTPEVRKRRTLQALVDQLAGLAVQQPVLALYEDAHWIDPSTLEFLCLVIERIRQLPVLVLITFRPQFQPPWSGQAHVTTLTMSRLGRRQGADLVARVTGEKPLPAEIVDQIVARTDGVPLFVEELTKTVLESGLLADAGDHYELSGPLPLLAIPTTLHDSLMARLDRLASVKEVAQIGAVIGREFSHELLAAISPVPEDKLSEALNQLVASELVFRRGAPPDATYSFKHALVQDAAYQSLPRSRRQQLHGRIACVLEERLLEAEDAQPELLAHHCTEAGLSEKAVKYWYQAGRLASERSALAEAIGHFRKGLELLATLPDPSAGVEREIDLQIALGGALISAKGHAAPETGRAYARAHELCRQVGDLGRLSPLLFGQWVFHMVRAEHAAAQGIAEELLRSAEREGDAAVLVSHRVAGIGSLWRGELVEAREHLERTLALYDPERHRSLASVYAYDLRLAGLAGLAFALFQLGYPEQAVARCREAVDDAEWLSHPAGLAYSLFHACMLDQIRREIPGVRQRAAALVALSAEHGFALWQAAGVAFDGWALAERGRAAEGIARIESGLDSYRATGAGLFVPYFLGILGTAHGAAGRVAEGQRLLADALDAVRASGECWFGPELHRLNGELLSLAGRDRGTAEACFLSAMAVAREQAAKLWELRAATSLARLWAEQGRRTEALDLLAPIYAWFTEGFDTADLKGAEALLDELA
jgi:class 3 adenylate cyclase/predicted ATPase